MISNRAVKAVAESLEEASRGSHEGGRGGVEAFLAWLEERRVHPQSRLYAALKDVVDAKTQAAAVSTCDARDLVLWYVNGLFVIGHGADGRMGKNEPHRCRRGQSQLWNDRLKIMAIRAQAV